MEKPAINGNKIKRVIPYIWRGALLIAYVAVAGFAYVCLSIWNNGIFANGTNLIPGFVMVILFIALALFFFVLAFLINGRKMKNVLLSIITAVIIVGAFLGGWFLLTYFTV